MTADDLTFRPLRPAELPTFRAALDLAFHDAPLPADSAPRWTEVLDWERTITGWEGDQLVATSGAFAQRLSVPGGELPCAGVTVITVRPTHRRRGILRRMMAGLLEQAVAAGEPLAGLWAAEGGIYERFGYGVASRMVTLELPGGAPPPRRAASAVRTIELVPFEQADPALTNELWERVRAQRSGIPARSPAWWAVRPLADREAERRGGLAKRLLVARDGDGAPQGYAIYRAFGGEPRGRLEVAELIAPDPDAEAALWEFLASIDLVATVTAPMRPVDDPLPLRFADARQARMLDPHDALWLRVLDLPAAVAGRSWAAPADLVVELADDQLPASAGTWRLETAAEGDGRATRADGAAPDLTLDAAALGAAYLGGTSLQRLADAGRVQERTPGALARLDAALHVPRAPWTPEFF